MMTTNIGKFEKKLKNIEPFKGRRVIKYDSITS